MRKIVKWIPNALTCCNLLCGTLAIMAAMMSISLGKELYLYTFWLIVAAAVFDFFDGFAARMLKAYSDIGRDLDSLADVVSFGVAPAVTLCTFIVTQQRGDLPHLIATFTPLLLAAFAALRLAKFNNDPSQSEEFKGLPTPAMGLFFVSYIFIDSLSYTLSSELLIYGSAALALIFCGLMVCNIPMFSFKFKNFSLKANALRYFFLVFAVLAIIALGYLSPAVIIATYILVSIIRWRVIKA